MKGDFSRDTFNPTKHYSRVLMQQGRVLLDADWNEQTSILLHYLRALATDIIGPFAGPSHNLGFGIITQPMIKIIQNHLEANLQASGTLTDEEKNTLQSLTENEQSNLQNYLKLPDNTSTINKLLLGPNKFFVGMGHYYVDGILCENDTYLFDYTDQNSITTSNTQYLVYLDVWERLITSIQDGDIREVALGGPDTAVRAKVSHRVIVTDLKEFQDVDQQESQEKNPENQERFNPKWDRWKNRKQLENRGKLTAKGKDEQKKNTDPCVIPADAQYRGLENQLYRVEIHNGGVVTGDNAGATFKWSRDNGSVIFPILETGSPDRNNNSITFTLEHLGYDAKTTLNVDDWVEILDDDILMSGKPGPLAKVTTIQMKDRQVTLMFPQGFVEPVGSTDSSKHPFLRRWDSKKSTNPSSSGTFDENTGTIIIPKSNGIWVTIEDGIQIQFQTDRVTFRPGDYWLIPARTATGDILWPRESGNPAFLPPQGVEHHYAPLAILSQDTSGAWKVTDLRRRFNTIT